MENDRNIEKVIKDLKQQKDLSFTDIFTQIWTSPRKIFKRINDENYSKYVVILLALSGISRTFDQASAKNLGDDISIRGILGICIIAGGFIGWITYYIFAALISWTGKWLKGEGNTKSILNIIAYALIPSIIALVFLIPQISIYGNEMFKSDGDIISAGLIFNILVYQSLFFEFAFGIWTIVLLVIGISEVQKLSIGKSIINILLPGFLFMILILFIILYMTLFRTILTKYIL